MSLQFFVLLLFLVVEDQDLLGSALTQNFASHKRARTRLRNLAVAARYREHIVELDLAVIRALRFNAQYVPGRHPILFATGANDRVHNNASMFQGQADTLSTL